MAVVVCFTISVFQGGEGDSWFCERFNTCQHHNCDFESSRRVTISQDSISFVHHAYTSSTDNQKKQTGQKKIVQEWRNLGNLDSETKNERN